MADDTTLSTATSDTDHTQSWRSQHSIARCIRVRGMMLSATLTPGPGGLKSRVRLRALGGTCAPSLPFHWRSDEGPCCDRVRLADVAGSAVEV